MSRAPYPTSNLELIFGRRHIRQHPVVNFDGGCVQKFTADQIQKSEKIRVGKIIRTSNKSVHPYTVQDTNTPPVGIIVVWDSVNKIGAYQYNGALTLKLEKMPHPRAVRPWTPWWTNNPSTDATSALPHVGWVIAHRDLFVRIQIDPA